MVSSISLKIFLLFIILVNLKLPLNTMSNISFLIVYLGIFFIFEKKIVIQKFNYLIIIILTIINLSIPSNFIEEAHSIFVSKKDINIISSFLPKKIINIIYNDYNNSFDFERAIKSHDGSNFSSKDKLIAYASIDSPFAFSSDNFFIKSKFSRKINNINFKSREGLRIANLNRINYNLVYDKKFRRILPYYVFYKINNNYANSEVCTRGNLYYAYSYRNKYNLNTLTFNKQTSSKCLKIKKEFKNLYLIGYSINNDDNLSIKLKKNYLLKFYDYSSILIIFILFIFFLKLLRPKKNYKVLLFLYLSSVISLILITALKDINMITGLRYFRGGADGLFHQSQSYDIVKHLFNNEYFLALRGGEDIFYFMPGLRYFGALNNIIFGDTNYGYLIITLYFPIVIFSIFKNLIGIKPAIYLFISFIFFPIFENMGFGYFNYIGQVTRNHAETLSILLILSVIGLILHKKNNYINSILMFMIILFLSISVFARPNFFPTSLILISYLLFQSFRNKYYKNVIIILISSVFMFSSLIHNYFFGNSLTFFTISQAHFVFTDLYQNLNITDFKSNYLFTQLLKWNPLYNIHRIIILFITIFYILKHRQNLFIYSIFLCCLSQHFVLLITHPDSRYAYLAWLLTFILFAKVVSDNNLLKLIIQKITNYKLLNKFR